MVYCNTQPTQLALGIEEFHRVIKNSLRGFARVRLPGGVIIHDVAIHCREGKAWAQAPGKPVLDRNGQHAVGPDGKLTWTPVVSFASRADSDAFSNEVLRALRAKYPEGVS